QAELRAVDREHRRGAYVRADQRMGGLDRLPVDPVAPFDHTGPRMSADPLRHRPSLPPRILTYELVKWQTCKYASCRRPEGAREREAAPGPRMAEEAARAFPTAGGRR